MDHKKWLLITGDKTLLSYFKVYAGQYVVFRDNNIGFTMGYDKLKLIMLSLKRLLNLMEWSTTCLVLPNFVKKGTNLSLQFFCKRFLFNFDLQPFYCSSIFKHLTKFILHRYNYYFLLCCHLMYWFDSQMTNTELDLHIFFIKQFIVLDLRQKCFNID